MQKITGNTNTNDTIESLRQEIVVLRRALELALPGYLKAADLELSQDMGR